MFRSIGFIGGGRVTRILLGGWKLGQALPEVVRVSDPSADSLEKLRRLLPGIERFAGDNDPPASSDIVFLALHPPVIPGVLGKCPEVREDSLEAFAILTGMGPTYLWFQLVELMRLAETFGLGAEEPEEATYRMVAGAAKTLHESGLSSEDVIDLIPVKPLSDDEETIREIYRSKLSPLYRKLKG